MESGRRSGGCCILEGVEGVERKELPSEGATNWSTGGLRWDNREEERRGLHTGGREGMLHQKEPTSEGAANSAQRASEVE